MGAAVSILTANRLRDGEVAYWRAGRWVSELEAAEMFPDKAAANEALSAAEAAVRDRLIVNPYLFEARFEAGEILPTEVRERIRAIGPSIRPDLGKQAHHVPL
jgi:hypothetical protein